MKARKWLLYFAPFILIVLFALILGGGAVLKQPLGEDDQLLRAMRTIERNVKHKEWKGAAEQSEYASKAWGIIVNRIQFSVEREYMYDISNILARIQGGIVAHDEKAALEEIYLFYSLWDNLGR